MYLYVTFNPALDSYVPAGLLPSTRGRPAKNHSLGVEFQTDSGANFNYQLSVVSETELADAASADDLKKAVIASERNAASQQCLTDIGLDALTLLLAKAVTDTAEGLLRAPGTETMPGSMRLQLDVVHTALNELLSCPEPTPEQLKEMREILANNKKLLNVAMNTLNANWLASKGVTCAEADEKDEKPSKKKSEEKSSEESDVSAGPTASAFGFERFSGEKPELKVVDAAEEQAEVHGVFKPQPDSTYIINENTEQLFKILQVSRRHAPQNVNLIGPHGCGKTELAIQFAARCNMPMLIMDCANLREARDWFGFKTAREGTVYWHESQFVRAVEAGNHVILLDELNRANPHILNTLMPLLDGRRFTFLEEKGDKICVGPGTVFFATMNEGAGYTGTASLDRAFRDRFPRVVELTYLGEKDEINLLVNRIGIDKDVAKLLVEMANKIRTESSGLSATLTESISTRQLLAAATDFAIGGVETLQFTISNHFSPDGDDDSERVKVQNIIQGKFGHMLAAKAAKKGA